MFYFARSRVYATASIEVAISTYGGGRRTSRRPTERSLRARFGRRLERKNEGPI